MNQYLKKRCALILAAVTMTVSTVNPVMAAGTTVMELESESGTESAAVQDQGSEGNSEEETTVIAELETDTEADVEVSTEINTENSLEEISSEGMLGLETVVEPEPNMKPIAADSENLLTEEISDEESTTDWDKAIISEEETADQENTLEVNDELVKNGEVKDVGTLKVDKELSGTLNGNEEVRYSFKPTATGYYRFEIQADQNLRVELRTDKNWVGYRENTNKIYLVSDEPLIKNTNYNITVGSHWSADKSKPNSYKIKVKSVTKTIKENEKASQITEKPETVLGYCFTPKFTASYEIALLEYDANVRGISSVYDELGNEICYSYGYKQRECELTKGHKYYFVIAPSNSENFKQMKYSIHIASTKSNNMFRYAVHEKKVNILRYLGRSETVKIPDKIDGNTVVAIGDNAFYGESDLKTVTFPDSVKRIDRFAFENCTSLKTIKLPKKIEELGYSAFSGCISLESVTLDTKVEMLSGEVFKNCSKLKKVTLPEKLKVIGADAFSNCKELETVKIPNTVTEIERNAFAECSKLKKIELPDGLLQLGNFAFENCINLEQMKLPAKVSFDRNPFGNCVKLKNIPVDSANPYIVNIGGMLYKKTSASSDELELLVCPAGKTGTAKIISGTTSTGYGCFVGCSKITEVMIEPNVDLRYSESVFQNCLNLKKFTVDTENKYCKSIDGVLYDTGYDGDKLYLMSCPPAIESVDIAEGVEYIGGSVFKNCSKLKKVTIPSTMKKFECGDEGIFHDCTALTNISVSPDNPVYKSVDDAVYSKDGRILCIVPCGKKGEFRVPDGVTQLGGSLSEKDEDKWYIYRTFDNCAGITKIKIPASVESIDARSFIGCSKLESIEVDSKNKAYYSKSGVLYDSKQKTLICCPSNIKSLTILPTVTTIAYNAFYRTNLKKVDLPASVKKFEKQSVVICDFGLYFNSSKVADFNRSWVETSVKDKDGNYIRIVPTGYYYPSKTAWKAAVQSTYEFAGIPWKEIESKKVTLSQPKLKKAASAAKGKIKVTWSKVSGATGYIVYKKSGKEWKKLATVKSPTVSYTDKGLTSGKKYTYTVAAYKKKDGKTTTSTYDKTGVSTKAK